MSYNTLGLLEDVQLKPIPQLFNDMDNNYEHLAGLGNASLTVRGRQYQVGNGATTTTIPMVSSSGLTIFLTPAQQSQLVGGSVKIVLGSTLCEAQITAVSASGTLTLDSALPSAPTSGTSFVIVPPDQVSLTGSNVPLVASAPRLLTTEQYTTFQANTPIYPSMSGVLNRNARQRTLLVQNNLNIALATCSFYVSDSTVSHAGEIPSQSGGLPGADQTAVLTSEEYPLLNAHVDTLVVGIGVGSTLPTSGAVNIYIVELF